jgi:hypothetical protein
MPDLYMSNKELSGKFLEGLEQALKELVQKKAALGQSLVVANAQGQITIISAKEVLKKSRPKKS